MARKTPATNKATRMSKEKEALMLEGVSRRLRAVIAQFGYDSYPQLGKDIGAGGNSINNWVARANLPRVPSMIRLCELTGITLDWLYRGESPAMKPEILASLNARVRELGRSIPIG